MFRAPYSKISAKMLNELKKDKYTLVGWDIDCKDWDYKNSSAKFIQKTVLAQAKPGAIVILHDGRDVQINYPRDNMIKALPEIIKALKKDGYTFVTIDKLLNINAYY